MFKCVLSTSLRKESYLKDHSTWGTCTEPKNVVEFNVGLFSTLLVTSALQLILCAIQMINGLFGCLCGTCKDKGVRHSWETREWRNNTSVWKKKLVQNMFKTMDPYHVSLLPFERMGTQEIYIDFPRTRSIYLAIRQTLHSFYINSNSEAFWCHFHKMGKKNIWRRWILKKYHTT